MWNSLSRGSPASGDSWKWKQEPPCFAIRLRSHTKKDGVANNSVGIAAVCTIKTHNGARCFLWTSGCLLWKCQPSIQIVRHALFKQILEVFFYVKYVQTIYWFVSYVFIIQSRWWNVYWFDYAPFKQDEKCGFFWRFCFTYLYNINNRQVHRVWCVMKAVTVVLVNIG